MLLLARHSARVQSSTCIRSCRCVPNRLYTSSDVIQAGDRVLLQKGGRDPILHVEFHVGDVSKWIDKQVIDRRLDSQDEPFLSHVILDMPAAQHHFEKATSVLYVHGSLLAFNPSITQIMEIVELVEHECLPLQLDRVIELGPSVTGGREWDVRSVMPRARQTAATQDESGAVEKMDEGSAEESRECISSSESAESETRDEGVARTLARQNASWKMICRPKVGYKVTGGGFLGVWRKISG